MSFKRTKSVWIEDNRTSHDNEIKLTEPTLKEYVEIWGDVVRIRDLCLALLICSIATFLGYFLSPNESYKPLLFGLLGSILGFIISGAIIIPKRMFLEEDEE